MPARVVCISRTLGAGGTDVGRLVSERLGFRYLDEEIVGRAAEKGQVDPDLVVDVEQRSSIARRAGEKLVRESDAARAAYFKEFYGLSEESPTHYDLVVNTGLLTVAETAELVVAAAGFGLDAA